MPSPIVEPLEDLDLPTTRANPAARLTMFVVLGLCLFVGWRYIGPQSALAEQGWISNWDTAVERREASGKPALVLFTADWCPSCRQLESQVLSQPEVTDYLRDNFTLVVVDLSDRGGPNAARARDFGVQSIPTLIRYDKSNQEVARSNGMDADKLIAWLKK